MQASRRIISMLTCAGALVGGACSQKPDPVVQKMLDTPTDDERVTKIGNDYYPKSVVEEQEAPELPERGRGTPDESNGVCRLFAPELPSPQCCTADFGIDVDSIASQCGHAAYLGESLSGSCGYFFSNSTGAVVSIRTAYIRAASTREAATRHAAELVTKFSTKIEPSPVPNLAGAYQVDHAGYHWAFLPGWKKLRIVTWNDQFCAAHQMPTLLAEINASPEPAEGAERLSVIPRHRPAAGHDAPATASASRNKPSPD